MIRKLTILIFLFAIILTGVFAIADWAKAVIYTYENFDSYPGGSVLSTNDEWVGVQNTNTITVTAATEEQYQSPYKSAVYYTNEANGVYSIVYLPFSSVGSTANIHYFDFDFKVSTTTVAGNDGTPYVLFQTPEGITACGFSISDGSGDIIVGNIASTTLTRIRTNENWHHVIVKINNELDLCQYSVQNLTTGEYIVLPSENIIDTYTAYSNLTTKEIGRIELRSDGCTGGACDYGDFFWIDNLSYAPVNTRGETVSVSFLLATSSDSLYATFVNFASSSFPIINCDADNTWGASFVKVTICHIKNGIMDLLRVLFVPPQFTLDMFKESIEGFRDVFPMSVVFEAIDSIYYGLAISETDSGLTLPALITSAGQTVFPGYTFVSTSTLSSVNSSAYSSYRTLAENIIWISLFIGIIIIIV